MKEIAESFKSLIDKLAEFFEILDLAFLISGFSSLGAFAFWHYKASVTIGFSINNSWTVLLTILMAYVVGLISFAGGRFIRRTAKKIFCKRNFSEVIKRKLKSHGLETDRSYEKYFNEEREMVTSDHTIVAKMWAELRQNKNYGYSLAFLKKYWLISATYDGLIFSAFLWATFIIDLNERIGKEEFWIYLLFVVIAILACWSGADRYDEYQNEELAASIAVEREIAAKKKNG